MSILEKADKKKLNKKMGAIVEESIAKLLDEGYFKSYPTAMVKKTIEALLKKSPICKEYKIEEDEEKDNENDFQILSLFVIGMNEELKEKIEEKLSLCGWYIGNKFEDRKNGIRIYGFSLEPKFPSENSSADKRTIEVIKKYKTFYHVSFRKFRNKILTSGLVPSNLSRNDFEHPTRIYLFSEQEIAEDFARYGYTKNLTFAKNLHKRKIRQTDAKPEYQDRIKSDKDYVVVFKVDLYQMLQDGKNIRLYHDNRFQEDGKAYFTQNTINPKYIKEIQF